MVLLDLLGRRKTLRILWDLSQAGGPLKFRELQQKSDTNPTVLNARLKELKAGRLVAHDGTGYELTAEGRSLLGLIMPLHSWAEDWSSRHTDGLEDDNA
jgi:DNA-binding HxlR family transcriptional regulator